MYIPVQLYKKMESLSGNQKIHDLQSETCNKEQQRTNAWVRHYSRPHREQLINIFHKCASVKCVIVGTSTVVNHGLVKDNSIFVVVISAMILQPILCQNHANAVALVGTVANGLDVELYKWVVVIFVALLMLSTIQLQKTK